MSSELSTLFNIPHAPGFIYLQHPHTPTSSSVPTPSPGSIQAQVSAIEYNTARLLYSGILHRIAISIGTTWTGGEVRTWEGFSRGLKTLWDGLNSQGRSRRPVKGSKKGKEKEVAPIEAEVGGTGEERLNWVVLVTHAERLPRILGPQWSVLTRLAELVRLFLFLMRESVLKT